MVVFSQDLTMATLSTRLKEMAGDESIEITDVPPDQVAKLKMNLTLSGFIQIAVSANVVTGKKPNVLREQV